MRKKILIPVLVSVFMAAAIFLSVGTYQVVNAASFERRGGGFGMGGPANEYLAEALGITVDELTAAREQAHEAAIQQALDEGLITQEQAEQMRNNQYGMGGRRFMAGTSTIDHHALLADALGITVDELNAARETAHQAHLAQAVADGTITQEQADQMERGEYGMGRGGSGMHGGRGGMGRGGMRGTGTCQATPAE